MRSLPAPARNPREARKLQPPVSQNAGTKLLKTRGKSDPLHHTHFTHPAGGRRVSTERESGWQWGSSVDGGQTGTIIRTEGVGEVHILT